MKKQICVRYVVNDANLGKTLFITEEEYDMCDPWRIEENLKKILRIYNAGKRKVRVGVAVKIR